MRKAIPSVKLSPHGFSRPYVLTGLVGDRGKHRQCKTASILPSTVNSVRVNAKIASVGRRVKREKSRVSLFFWRLASLSSRLLDSYIGLALYFRVRLSGF